ncbi:MAG: Nramp family divalent metal transporter [Nanoarchaeota archaeon]|nr:Nramp family divalent metal transporter [Nanoarchaeota archaeon]
MTSKNNSDFPPLGTRELPAPPRWRKVLGVGIVMMGLAIGTGELILWPHLITKHGLGILWLALLGISFQYFINQEVARHTLATGESFFTTSSRVFKWSAVFWLASAKLVHKYHYGSDFGILPVFFGGNYPISYFVRRQIYQTRDRGRV